MELLPTRKKLLHNTTMKLTLATITLILLVLARIPLYLFKNSSSPSPLPVSTKLGKKCDMIGGKWTQSPKGPYYTNVTSRILDQQNCMKFGRPDTEFLKWRWKPDECELPMFDAAQFLELVRGKSIAFIGNSGQETKCNFCFRYSLLIFGSLTSESVFQEGDPMLVSNTKDLEIKRYLYTNYNFTVVLFWSPYLVKAIDVESTARTSNRLMNVYLDEAHEAWMAQIETFSYVIVLAGNWFFVPRVVYENGNIVGCHLCHKENVTNLAILHGYRKVFQTTLTSRE
ncbi:hypothetical protein PVL29_018808 [Vitis rotundifolia]|uniref:Trichome birefringence-like N-terminal domain-containing protein n=1 Tax=Vitis rotundifolia TaxID=103349 RepID=A0AA38Z6W1_VITRO|nr:hypothetical protein PVL29_018808 [Vitis rotundifolia]